MQKKNEFTNPLRKQKNNMYLFEWGESLDDPDGKLVCDIEGFLECLERVLCELNQSTCFIYVYQLLKNFGFMEFQDLGVSLTNKLNKLLEEDADIDDENDYEIITKVFNQCIKKYVNSRKACSISDVIAEIRNSNVHQCLEISQIEFVGASENQN
jgi:hypothetical protein